MIISKKDLAESNPCARLLAPLALFALLVLAAPRALAAEDLITNLSASAEPFNLAVTYSMTLADTVNLQVGVYNATGNLVRRLIPNARHRADTFGLKTVGVSWNAWDDDSNLVTAGAGYTLRAAAGFKVSFQQTISSAGAQVGDARDVDVDTEGNVYVVQRATGAFIKYSGANGAIIFNKTIPGTANGFLNSPTGIAVNSSQQRVYILDNDPDSITAARVQTFSAFNGAFLNDSIQDLAAYNDGEVTGGLFFQDSGTQKRLHICLPGTPLNGRGGSVDCFNISNGLNSATRLFRSYQPNNPNRPNANERTYDVAMNPNGIGNVYHAMARVSTQTAGRLMIKDYADYEGVTNAGWTLGNARLRSLGVAYNPNNQRVYVTYPYAGADSVAGLNVGATSGDVTARFTGDGTNNVSQPWGVAVSPFDSTVWVVNNTDGLLWQLRDDTNVFTVLQKVPPPAGALSNPTDIAVGPDGKLYVVNAGSARVVIYNTDGSLYGEFGDAGNAAGQFNDPFGIAVDTDGYIYVSDKGREATNPLRDDRIQVFKPWDHATNPLEFDTIAWINDSSQNTQDYGWRGLDFQPVRPNGTPERLYAVTGRVETNDDDNNGVYVFQLNPNKTLTLVGGMKQNARVNYGVGTILPNIDRWYFRDVTSDWEGRIYAVTNYLEVDGNNTNGYKCMKVVLVFDSGLQHMSVRNQGNRADSTITNEGAPLGIVALPYGEVLVSNSTDQQDFTLGTNQVEFYHWTDTQVNTVLANSPARMDTAPRWTRPVFGQSDGANNLSRPTALAYSAGSGINSTDYVWVVDYGNVLIRRYKVEHNASSADQTWQDVDQITTTRQGTTPTVTSAVIAGDNVRTIGTTQYVKAGGPCTVTITFSRTMDTTTAPYSTPTVKLVSSVNSEEITATQIRYSGNVLTCTVASLPGSPALADGRVRVKVEGARDLAGTPLVPDPTDTDLYSFQLDVTKPSAIHVTSPSTPTSEPRIEVAGTATDNQKLYRIFVYNDTATTGVNRYDTAIAQSDAFTSFINWNVTGLNLQTAPSNNYIYAIAEDAAGNLSDTSDGAIPNYDGERRLVVRQDLIAGSGRILPDADTGYRIGSSARWRIRYTASQSLTADTITIAVPSGFTKPQGGNSALPGYTYLFDSSNVVNPYLIVDGTETITVGFTSLTTGAWIEVVYGDSAASTNGLAKINDGSIGSEPVSKLGANDFVMTLWDDGDTPTNIPGESPPPDLSLTVIGESVLIADSTNLAIAFQDVYSGQANVEIVKLTLTNTNLAASGKDVRIAQITLRLADTYGNALNWSRVFSKVQAGSDTGSNIAYYALNAAPPTSSNLTLDLSLNTLSIPAGGGVVDLYLTGSIAPTSTSSDSFQISILSASSFTARVPGDGSNAPVTVAANPGFTAYPVAAAKQRVTTLATPDTLLVGRIASADRSASEDQDEIIPLRLVLANPIASRPFYVERLQFRVEGPSGSRVPSTVIRAAKLRDDATSVVHVSKSSIESSGDSMTFSIPFTSANPLTVGGTTAETRTIQVVLQIASSVTHNDTFRLILAGLDTSWIQAFDHPTGQTSPSNQRNNESAAAGITFPIRSGVVTVQKKALVTHAVTRITDLQNNDTIVVTQGAPFRVHVGLSAAAGRSGAVFKSQDTDLVFYRANGTVDITSEFTITSRTAMTDSDLAAGGHDTVIYEVIQVSPFSGAGETLVVNNFIGTDTALYMYDKNSQADAVKLRVYALEGAKDTDFARIDSTFINAARITVTPGQFQPNTTGNRIMLLRLTDVGTQDTLVSITLHNEVAAVSSMIRNLWIALDANKNGVFDTGVDPFFAASQNFKTTDTVTFIGSRVLGGSGDTLDVYAICDIETGPVVDSTLISVLIPISGLGFQGRESLPQAPMATASYFRTRVVATRINVSPDTSTVVVGGAPVLTIRAEDTWANLDAVSDYSAIGISAIIRDTATPATEKSARWTASTLASPLPASLPSALYYDTTVTGSLAAGVATVTLTDTQGETLQVVVSTGSIPGETVLVGFSATPGVGVTALTSLARVAPDSRNVVMLVFLTSYPSTATNIDSIWVRSENTKDTNVRWVRIWRDVDDDGALDTTVDANLDTATWSGDVAKFFADAGESYAKPAGVSGVRWFVTYDMDTYPLADGDSLGCRIETGSLRMSGAGFFPATGELDSLEPDATNAVVHINATHVGGQMRWIDPGAQATGVAFEMTLRAQDRFGNIDDLVTTPLSDQAAKNVTVSASPAGITFNSTSMNLLTALPASSFSARFRNGAETLSMTGSLTGNIVITADVATPPPADTTITINFTGTEWARGNRSLTDTNVGPGETAVALVGTIQNLQGGGDTFVSFVLQNIGTVRYYDIACVELFADTNGNGLLDTNVDKRIGSGVFGATESLTIAILNTDTIAAGESRTYFVVVRLQDTLTSAVFGDTVKVRINASGCSTVISTSPCPPANLVSPESVAVKARFLWTMDTFPLADTALAAGDVGQVLGRFLLRNFNTRTDTLQQILIRDLGDSFVAFTDIANVGLWMDANGNSAFDTGVDTFLANTAFTAQETAAFNLALARPPYSWDTFFVVASVAAVPAAADGDTIRLRYPALGCSTAFFGAFPAVNLSYAESIAFQKSAATGITCTHLAIAAATVTGGAQNVLIGRYDLRNGKQTTDTITSITVRNAGTHPDTGLVNVRVALDANANGSFDAGVDTIFGYPGRFQAGSITCTGTRWLQASGAGDSIIILVLADLGVGQAVDSTRLGTRIDTGDVVSQAGDTAPPFPASSGYHASSGEVWVRVILSPGGESVLVGAGTELVGDTLFVTVTVRDTVGNLAQGRSVQLYTYGPTILTANPVSTDTSGFVTFGIRSVTAGAYRCTVVIAGTVFPSAYAYANFLSATATDTVAFSENTQRTTNTSAGATPLFSAPADFSRTTAGRGAELRYNNADYSIYFDIAGTPTLIWTVNNYTNFSITNPGPTWTSLARVRTVKGVGNDNVVFGGFSASYNYGVNLYYKPWGAPAGAAPTRISPNDSRSAGHAVQFDTDAQFDQFDIDPAGETVVFAFDGNLAVFHPAGATFDPIADAKTLSFLTTLQPSPGYQVGGPWLAYPEFSPDGQRIAVTMINRSTGWPTAIAPGGSDSAEIYVLRDIHRIAKGSYPLNTLSSVTSLADTRFVRVTRATGPNAIKFAWRPHWSQDGALLLFSGDNSGNFNYEAFSQTENPEQAIAASGVDFDGYMIYYDAATETSPYAPIAFAYERGVNELVGAMDTGVTPYISYVRSTGPGYYEQRTLTMANEATVNANGGVLFDSGRVVAVVRPDNSYGSGFTIAVKTPDTPAAPTTDSIIISGLAKQFFRPDTPTSPVYFTDSVIIFLYYDRRHFSETELVGYDSDGDGIPDRTEAAVGAYYYNGTQWVAYPTVRYPSQNKIQFWTDHFSDYAVGVPMDVRALAFNGTVHEIVAYPNPWRADRSPTATLGVADPAYGIKLTNFPGGQTRVRIFTIAGELVLDATVDALAGTTTGTSSNANLRVTPITNTGRGTVSWNLANQSGRAVASGVYLITIDGPGGRAVRKVAVIR